jgi:hypothetical protein
LEKVERGIKEVRGRLEINRREGWLRLEAVWSLVERRLGERERDCNLSEVEEGRKITMRKFREDICGKIRINDSSGGNWFKRKPEVENLVSYYLYG